MRDGKLARVEELTRIPADVQDALITVLSEKTLPVPELGQRGPGGPRASTLIATANDRDRGVNELSSALRRRFNTVVLPLPATRRRRKSRSSPAGSPSWAAPWSCPPSRPRSTRSAGSCTVFRELRTGVTEDGRTKLKSPTGTLSTAEAISVVTNGMALAAHFGDGRVRRRPTWPPGMIGAVVKDPAAGPGGLARVPGDRGQGARRTGGTCTGPAGTCDVTIE